MWAVATGVLLAIFWVVDQRNFSRAPREVREMETAHEEWRFEGLANLIFLAIILGAVFLNQPVFLREALMIGAALGSYFTTRERVHEANHFNFHPIEEVAILFVGIFATMLPALDWLKDHAGELLGQNPPSGVFYWGCGLLSSMLDNAPTYLSFLSAAMGSFVNHDVVMQVQHLVHTGGADLAAVTGPDAEHIRATFEALQKYHGASLMSSGISQEEIGVCYLLGNLTFNKYIVAISISAVFFGANTYIGNGPNFMVKSIAAHQKVPTPTFLGYMMKYTLPFLIPMEILVWWLFFRS